MVGSREPNLNHLRKCRSQRSPLLALAVLAPCCAADVAAASGCPASPGSCEPQAAALSALGDDVQLLQLSRATRQRRVAGGREAAGQRGPAEAASQHHWPHARGQVPGQHSVTAHQAPRELEEHMAWQWHHPMGRYFTTVAGSAVIDSQSNLYLTTNEHLRKFAPDGQVLWEYKPPGLGIMTNQATLMGDRIFGNAQDGMAFCLDLDGTPVWERRQAESSGSDVGYPGAFDGVLVMAMNAGFAHGGGNWDVLAVNGTDGEPLWQYHPDMVVWDFMPLFPGDDTIVFMDEAGGMYRLGLHNGSLIWKQPPEDLLAFTDGGAIISPDGTTVFSCSNPPGSQGYAPSPGVLRAYALATGTPLWERLLPMPCNSWPVVGDLGGDQPSVLVPIGGFMHQPQNSTPQAGQHAGGIMAFDAASGELQFKWQAPVIGRDDVVGDAEGLATRLVTDPLHIFCLPPQWSAPTMAADGAVYIGRADGFLYVLRAPARSQFEAPGVATERLPINFDSTPGVDVERFDLGAGFTHGGTAWAPGMMAIATCDTLFVYHYPEN